MLKKRWPTPKRRGTESTDKEAEDSYVVPIMAKSKD